MPSACLGRFAFKYVWSTLLLASVCGCDADVVPATACETYDTSFEQELSLLDVPISPRPPALVSTLVATSSYERVARSPGTEAWFSNTDRGEYLRRDRFGHGVLAEHTGAGALLRLWSANPNGRLRIYIDDDRDPRVDVDMESFLSEANPLGAAFAYGVTLSAPGEYGANLYVPIPFERYIRVTHEKSPEAAELFWQASLKAYEPGICVQSFDLESAPPAALEAATNALTSPVAAPMETVSVDWSSARATYTWSGAGDGAELTALCVASAAAIDSARTVLELTFDGVTTVRAPLRDFFAGLNEEVSAASFYTSYDASTAEWCTRFRMPFASEARLDLIAASAEVGRSLQVSSTLRPAAFEGSRYFHAHWQRTAETLPNLSDQRAVTIDAGGGHFVGLVMALTNRSHCWWGEGDEKVWVDDEPFPRLFGTGTEDYFGYAWSFPEEFTKPFHGQPEARVGRGQDICGQGEDLGGTWWNYRFHHLDPIAFQSSLRFDMEVWHWGGYADGNAPMDQAFTGFWYGNRAQPAPSLPDLAERPGVWEGEAAL